MSPPAVVPNTTNGMIFFITFAFFTLVAADILGLYHSFFMLYNANPKMITTNSIYIPITMPILTAPLFVVTGIKMPNIRNCSERTVEPIPVVINLSRYVSSFFPTLLK